MSIQNSNVKILDSRASILNFSNFSITNSNIGSDKSPIKLSDTEATFSRMRIGNSSGMSEVYFIESVNSNIQIEENSEFSNIGCPILSVINSDLVLRNALL